MKAEILHAIRKVISDRLFAASLIAVIILALAYSAWVAISLHPSDLQVAVHYTIFGETQFYRDKWYYLVAFVVFGLSIAIIHPIIAAKIYLQEKRQFAFLFAFLSVFMIVIAWALTREVLEIAFL